MINLSQIGAGNFSGVTGGDAAGVAGGLAGLAGGFIGASGATQAGNAQAAAYQQNALTAGMNAQRTLFQLGEQQNQSQYQENALIGRQKADYGAAGVSPTAGSPLDVAADTEQQYKTEALNRVYAGKFASQTASQQAQYDQQAAAAAQEAAKTNATASILGGFGSLLNIGKLFSGSL